MCGKTFNSRDNRNAHRFVHSDKKPYECTVCHQGFMRKPLLLAHMEAQQHLNNQIIVNQPNFKKDGDNLQGDANETDDNDIVYLSMNDDEFMDDDEFVSGRVSQTTIFLTLKETTKNLLNFLWRKNLLDKFVCSTFSIPINRRWKKSISWMMAK